MMRAASRRLSRKLSQKRNSMRKSLNGKKSKQPVGDHAVYSFTEGEEAWMADAKDAHEWVKVKVLSQTGLLLTVRVIKTNRLEQVDLRKRHVFPCNPTVEADMTSLYHINEPGILFNLETRSYDDKPYTFMGNVLVSVNPLKDIPAPKGALGTSAAALNPHPYAIAEFAFQQMSFAGDNRKKREDDFIVNQSVVTSGESGAGKTESSKMVLRHLVERTSSHDKLSEIDRRLLKSNPITEAFGNAKTLRNRNSSRFGKFMKLHFLQEETARDAPASWQISAASVVTYLLERSRVTMHQENERNYHMFYFLLAGSSGEQKKEFQFDKVLNKLGFRYLAALESTAQPEVSWGETAGEILKSDASEFREVESAMKDLDFSKEEINSIFRIVAGILHLGNVGFVNKEEEEGDVAHPAEVLSGSYVPLDCAAELLGVNPQELEELLLERTISTRDGNIVVHRNADSASFTRDAVAKGLYSHLFDHVVKRVNKSLDETGGGQNVDQLPFIGVLDIFGFESFKVNGFEQLLINFTNESLQSTFNKKVFEAEMSLYEQEGLILDQEITLPPTNEEAMTLLAGRLKNPGSEDHSREDKDAILVDLDLQCRELKPSDQKMLKVFNTKFEKHPNYPRPHPKIAHNSFIIKHYAGSVTYTVGNFIEKNNDQLPKEINDLFAKSASSILQPIFQRLQQQEQKKENARKGKAAQRSIVKQFRGQIIQLLDTLEATACSFIRCVKPNSTMTRDGEWFSRSYVGRQLKHLSIPQTAIVLRSGLPTRIRYETLVESYMKVLPKEATMRFKKGKVLNSKLFVSALFWSFQVDPKTFKMGHTKVFFKAGQIAALDKVLQRASLWTSSNNSKMKKEREEIGKRFRFYYSRLQWRRAMVKVVAQNHFVRSLVTRRRAVVMIQKTVRMFVAHRKTAHLLENKRQKAAREKREKAEAVERQKKMEEEEKRKKQIEEELKRKEEEEYQKIMNHITVTKTKIALREKTLAEKVEEYGSDVEFDESEIESELSSLSDEEDDPERAKQKRMKRYYDIIETEAEEATEKYVKEQESQGKSVSATRREEIRMEFEAEYARKMARYEALREQNEALRVRVMEGLENLKELTGGAFNVMVHHGSNFVQSAKSWLDKTLPKNRTKKLNLQGLQEQMQENDYIEGEMKNNPVVQSTMKRMETILDAADAQQKQNAPKFKKPSMSTLRRQSTLRGTQYFVKVEEMENPAESARGQYISLKALLDDKKISPDEFRRMTDEIGRALKRRSMRSESEDSTEEVGMQLTCQECNTVNNTIDGPTCHNCHTPLKVDIVDQTRAFQSPQRDTWAGKPLIYKEGEFFIKMDDHVLSRQLEGFNETKVFIFECAWQKGNNPKIYTRWVVELEAEELESMSIMLGAKKNLLGKGKKMPPFPFPMKAVPKKKGKKGRYSRMKTMEKLGKGNKKEKRDSSPYVTLDQKVSRLQDWLEEIIEELYNAHKKEKNNPVFKLCFDKVFDVDAHIHELLQNEAYLDG